jgi:mRNA-degrading endonuclease RelE of RelBE toxin-antitoxin system
MSYKVDTIAPFRKEAKKLNKKYPSLKKELEELVTVFQKITP